MLMAGTYESRKVGRDDFDWGFVSTAAVNDSSKPYETAVEHRSYNGGEMVIVEIYDTKEAAAKGHAKWVKTMTADTLPKVLRDVSTAGIAELLDAVGGDEWREKSQGSEASARKTAVDTQGRKEQ